jgi:hypothetical protein
MLNNYSLDKLYEEGRALDERMVRELTGFRAGGDRALMSVARAILFNAMAQIHIELSRRATEEGSNNHPAVEG